MTETENQEIDPGWYHVDEVWMLYIDGEQTKAHVTYVRVHEPTDEGQYKVDHYGHGEFLSQITVGQKDLSAVLHPSQKLGRPFHL